MHGFEQLFGTYLVALHVVGRVEARKALRLRPPPAQTLPPQDQRPRHAAASPVETAETGESLAQRASVGAGGRRSAVARLLGGAEGPAHGSPTRVDPPDKCFVPAVDQRRSGRHPRCGGIGRVHHLRAAWAGVSHLSRSTEYGMDSFYGFAKDCGQTRLSEPTQ
jgi:hypothetical protein